MKKIHVFITLLLLVLSGCTSATHTENNEPKLQRSIEGIFSLEQTPEEFLDALKKEGIELNANPHTSDGRMIERDGYFQYETDDLRVMFASNEKPASFSMLSSRYSTDLGLRIGDSGEKMLDLYGHDYFQREGHPEQYGYIVGDLGMGFYVEDGLLAGWSIYVPSKQMDW